MAKQYTPRVTAAAADTTAESVAETTAVAEETVVETAEVQETPVAENAAPEAVLSPAPQEIVAAAPVVAQDVTKAAEPLVVQLVREGLEAYVKGMALNVPQTSTTAAKWQKRLYDVYHAALHAGPTEYRAVLGLVLETVKGNINGVFRSEALFRGMSEIQLPPAKQRLFSHLNHLFTTAAQMGAATAGRELDLTGIAKELATEEARTLLVQYFR